MWNYTTTDYVSSAPAIANGLVYAGSDDGNEYCINATTGALVWKDNLSCIDPTATSFANGRIYVGEFTGINDSEGRLACINSTSGVSLWNFTVGAAIEHQCAVAAGYVFFPSINPSLYCVNAVTGVLNWTFNPDGVIDCDPIIASGCIYITTGSATVYCLPMSMMVGTPVLDDIIPNPTIDANVSVTWKDDPGANSYALYRSSSFITNIGGLTPIASVDSTSFTDTLPEYGTYYYAIIAMNNLGNSSLSNCVNISYIQAVPPIAPVLYAINPNPTFTGQIEVIWGVPVQGATSYLLYRNTTTITSVSGLTPVNTVPSGSMAAQDNLTLVGPGTYYYVVVAVNASGPSPISNCVSVTYSTRPADYSASFQGGAGENHIVSLPTNGGLYVNATFNSTGPVDFNVSVWDSNPLGISPGFENDSNAIYVAFDVSNISAIEFPITLTIQLPADLQGFDPSTFKFMTYNSTSKSWQDAGFNMTIDTTTNIATITVEHFSLFSLGLKQGATSNGGGPTIPGYPIWSFMIFAAISTVIVIRKRNLKVHKL